ncbi:NADP-dependent oxidoreductase [Nonomuraea sp. NPDC050404]|uniref:NADP-dependent oxidoreductase n=1 Tax=Nonomuraea sp. NPDC050404 TaxID=3155783 RepID=UPI0033FF845F
MRAVAISAFGAEPLLIEAPQPEPRPGELLVRLRAAGYNPVDSKIAGGAMKSRMSPSFPFIMGQDGAGVVTAVGAEVSGFRPGEEVYGRFTDPARGLGSYAEYGVVAQDGPVARMPAGMIPEQAAAVPTASGTARDVIAAAGLDEGQTVLIVGATGGVGQSAIQLAALCGARVIATAGPADEEFVRGLGAAETVNHRGGPIAEQVLAVHPDGIDAVLELVSPPEAIAPLEKLLRPGGVICSTVHALDPGALAARELRGVNVINQASGEKLSDLADLIDAGKLRVRVEAQVPLERAPATLAGIADRHARGKTVFTL